jgi:hypothetical protein
LLLFGKGYFVFPPVVQKCKDQNVQTIILSVVLYGCETLSLTLREEQRLRMFENSVVRTIFGSKKRMEELAQ